MFRENVGHYCSLKLLFVQLAVTEGILLEGMNRVGEWEWAFLLLVWQPLNLTTEP